MTMVCVTHEMGFTKSAADQIIFLDEGLVVENTTPYDLFNNPKEDRTKLFSSQIMQH
jgi:general L-amino acid transport system ATP-binding protein